MHPDAPIEPSRLLDPIAASLAHRVERGELPGVLVALVTKDGLPAIRSVGHVDTAASRPMRSDTIVRIHSMSKPLMSAGFLTLVDRGDVALDTPLAAILPELSSPRVVASDGRLASAARPLTIRHLLTHTAGFVHANARGSLAERAMAEALGESTSEGPRISLADWLTRIAEVPLAHQPGEAWSYGVGLDVLGRAAEVLTGLTLDVFLHERLFAPLGMRDTGFVVPPSERGRIAAIHRRDASGLVPLALSHERPLFLSGGGGLVSTADDYLRFCRLLLGRGELDGVRGLAPASIAAMHTDQLGDLPRLGSVSPGRGCSFGLGGRIVLDPVASGYGSPGTYGWDGIGGTTFFVDPVRGLAGLLVTQTIPWPPRLHEHFRESVYARR